MVINQSYDTSAKEVQIDLNQETCLTGCKLSSCGVPTFEGEPELVGDV